MIGFDYLGKMGRLCNQMFQYAATKGISMNRDFEFCIPYPSGNDEWEHHRLFNCFDIEPIIGIINTNYIQEATFNFDEQLFENCPDNSSLVGYFQT